MFSKFFLLCRLFKVFSYNVRNHFLTLSAYVSFLYSSAQNMSRFAKQTVTFLRDLLSTRRNLARKCVSGCDVRDVVVAMTDLWLS